MSSNYERSGSIAKQKKFLPKARRSGKNAAKKTIVSKMHRAFSETKYERLRNQDSGDIMTCNW